MLSVGSIVGLTTLGVTAVGCTLFVRARYKEYRYVKRWLQGTTNQVLECLQFHRCFGGVLPPEDRNSFMRLGVAFYELGGTKCQRYVLKKAILASEYAPLWKALALIIEATPHPKNRKLWWFKSYL